jgi:hypothetical protein
MIFSAGLLVQKIRSLSAAQTSPRLLNAADKDLALVLSVASEADLRYILSYLSLQIQIRVQEELERMKHVKFNPRQYSLALKHLLNHLVSSKPLSPVRSHLKPYRLPLRHWVL